MNVGVVVSGHEYAHFSQFPNQMSGKVAAGLGASFRGA